MKIVVVGGNKGTGKAVAAKAVTRGDDVVIISRSAQDSDVAGATAVATDASDSTQLVEPLTGADAVVVTVGGSADNGNRGRVTRAVINAMQEASVDRLIVQSSMGAGTSARQLPFPLNHITPLMLMKPLTDHNEQEAALFASPLQWTVVRPAGLTNDAEVGTLTTLKDGETGKIKGRVTRADLAAFILSTIDDESTIHECISVSN